MTAFRIGTRTWSILGLSLALGGCARQPPSAPDGTKVAREEKPLVGVVEVTPEEAPQNLTAALGKARASCGSTSDYWIKGLLSIVRTG
jgi:hypothetical protein